jgi:hypothetical protein
VEPFWISLAFYDAEKKTKLSEDLYLEWNDTKTLQSLLKPSHSSVDPESNAKKGVFSFTTIGESIYAVVKVWHVMKGCVNFKFYK